MNKKSWGKFADFHGHNCPSLAIGFRGCELAMEEMNQNFSKYTRGW